MQLMMEKTWGVLAEPGVDNRSMGLSENPVAENREVIRGTRREGDGRDGTRKCM